MSAIGADLLWMNLRWRRHGWMPARHDAVTFDSVRGYHHDVRVELDLRTIPDIHLPSGTSGDLHEALLPLTWLPRSEGLDVRLRTGDGALAPTVPAKQERAIGAAAIIGFIQEVIPTAPDTEALAEMEMMVKSLLAGPATPTPDLAPLVDLTRQLGVEEGYIEPIEREVRRWCRNQMLIAILPLDANGRPPPRPIFEFRFYNEIPQEEQVPGVLRAAFRNVVATPTQAFRLPVPSWVSAGAQHVEITAPEGTELMNVVASYRRRDADTAESVTDNSDRQWGERVRLTLRAPTSQEYTAVVDGTIGVQFRGVYRAALIATATSLAAVLMVLGRFLMLRDNSSDLLRHVEIEGAASLLLVVPGFAGGLAFTAAEAERSSLLLWRMRVTMLTVAASAYAIALSLALKHGRLVTLSLSAGSTTAVVATYVQVVAGVVYYGRYRNFRADGRARVVAAALGMTLISVAPWFRVLGAESHLATFFSAFVFVLGGGTWFAVNYALDAEEQNLERRDLVAIGTCLVTIIAVLQSQLVPVDHPRVSVALTVAGIVLAAVLLFRTWTVGVALGVTCVAITGIFAASHVFAPTTPQGAGVLTVAALSMGGGLLLDAWRATHAERESQAQ
jgi:hypothetical protein